MPTLRKPKPPRSVVESARTSAQRFRKPSECWKQSSAHQRYFIETLKCDKDYHKDKYACKAFDNWVGKVAGDSYKHTFFNYYFVNPTCRLPAARFYTTEIITDINLIHQLATFAITRKPPHTLTSVPDLYEQWPIHFTFEYSAFSSPSIRKRMKLAIEACIRRRAWFRKECVLQCAKTITTDGHDQFLLVLQILRAKLMSYYNV